MKAYKLFVLLGLVVLSLTSCLKSEDLITGDAKTGGAIVAPGVVPYKGSALNINFTVVTGASVSSVKVKKYFVHNADTSTSTSSILQETIEIGGANKTEDVEKTVTVDWSDLVANMATLPKGYVIPADDLDAEIGDAFVLEFVSVMPDGREVIGAKTIISVANFFAGDYVAHLIYRHPSYGTYPDNIYVEEDNNKTLLATSGTTCVTSFGTWGPAEKMYITIDPVTYAVSIAVENWSYDVVLGDPNNASLVTNYNPTTGVITLYYAYMGSGGYRIFWETFTPVAKK